MNSGFFEALSLLGDENSVETEILVEKVKSALLKAIRKAYPDCEDNIRVDIDPANKKLEMYLIKTVVDDEPIDYNEINIDEARITHLAYAPEIAAAMLQRQQATAIIEARQKIVEGAVGMVDMALKNLAENNVCDLDDERKAQMVSNLLVVLCGNKDAQPIVNSGSIY